MSGKETSRSRRQVLQDQANLDKLKGLREVARQEQTLTFADDEYGAQDGAVVGNESTAVGFPMNEMSDFSIESIENFFSFLSGDMSGLPPIRNAEELENFTKAAANYRAVQEVLAKNFRLMIEVKARQFTGVPVHALIGAVNGIAESVIVAISELIEIIAFGVGRTITGIGDGVRRGRHG